MIIAGEASGDLYGSMLAEELRRRHPDVALVGVGGDKMERAGVELLCGITGSFGLIETLSSLRKLAETFFRIIGALKRHEVDVLVLIDFPEFNMRVAARAKKLGVKVLYYVSPQVWAWRTGRIKKIALSANCVAAILPFEKEIYEREKVCCRFVGHPVMEDIERRHLNVEQLKREFSLDPLAPVVALLPGSRRSELLKLLPPIVGAVVILKETHPELQYILPVAPTVDRGMFRREFSQLEALGVRLVEEKAVEALSVADAAVVASGTAAFQSALLDVPTVVIYKLSPITYRLAKILIKVKYANLANLILGREVLKELLQDDVTAENIAAEVRRLLEDSEHHDSVVRALDEVRAHFIGKTPTAGVVDMIEEIAGSCAGGPPATSLENAGSRT
jgi:lipid-A-disaccharide synthase